MAEVKDRMQGQPTLCSLDPRKVYDKVPSEWHFSDKTSLHPSDIDDDKPSAELPKESESS